MASTNDTLTATTTATTATAAAAAVAISVENPPEKKLPLNSVPSTSASLPDDLKPLPFSACKSAALTLAEAFEGDAVSDYFIHCPDTEHWTRERKWNLHVRIFEYLTYAHMMNGTALGAGQNAEGGFDCVSLWLTPNTNVDSIWTLLRSGLWRLYYLLSPIGRTRFFTEFFTLLHDTKLSVLGSVRDADSYYLVYVGTRPAGRGKGLATRMIGGMGEVARREGRWVYLESSNVKNRGLYERLGFRFVKRIGLGEGEGVGMEVMVQRE